jgi:hypothetical protein
MYKIMSSWIHTLFIKLFILIPVLSCCNVHMKVYLRVALVQMCMLYEWIVLFATAADILSPSLPYL